MGVTATASFPLGLLKCRSIYPWFCFCSRVSRHLSAVKIKIKIKLALDQLKVKNFKSVTEVSASCVYFPGHGDAFESFWACREAAVEESSDKIISWGRWWWREGGRGGRGVNK